MKTAKELARKWTLDQPSLFESHLIDVTEAERFIRNIQVGTLQHVRDWLVDRAKAEKAVSNWEIGVVLDTEAAWCTDQMEAIEQGHSCKWHKKEFGHKYKPVHEGDGWQKCAKCKKWYP